MPRLVAKSITSAVPCCLDASVCTACNAASPCAADSVPFALTGTGGGTRGEEGLAERVRDRPARTGRGEINGIMGGGGIKVIQRRQVSAQSVDVPAAHTGDELSGGQVQLCRPSANHLLQFRDRSRCLNDPHLVTRVESTADVVNVRIDETGDNRGPTEVDRMGAGAEGFRVPDLREPPVADCDRRDDRMRRIHREDATVYECEIPRASARRGIRPRGLPPYRPACCTCRRSRQHALNELAAQETTLPTINQCHGSLPVWPRRIRPSLRPRYSLRPQQENHQCPPFYCLTRRHRLRCR